jgi:hypothetical protein
LKKVQGYINRNPIKNNALMDSISVKLLIGKKRVRAVLTVLQVSDKNRLHFVLKLKNDQTLLGMNSFILSPWIEKKSL